MPVFPDNAFQTNAFQTDAFQIFIPSGPSSGNGGGGGAPGYGKPRKRGLRSDSNIVITGVKQAEPKKQRKPKKQKVKRGAKKLKAGYIRYRKSIPVEDMPDLPFLHYRRFKPITEELPSAEIIDFPRIYEDQKLRDEMLARITRARREEEELILIMLLEDC